MRRKSTSLNDLSADARADVTLIPFGQTAELLNMHPDTLDDYVRLRIIPRPLQRRPGGPKHYTLAMIRAVIAKRARARYVKPTPRGTLKQNKRVAADAE